MSDLHPQDWLLIVEGLLKLSHDMDERGIEPDRSDRAIELTRIIANREGLDLPEGIMQVDSEWSG